VGTYLEDLAVAQRERRAWTCTCGAGQLAPRQGRQARSRSAAAAVPSTGATHRGTRLARRLTVQQLLDWAHPFETEEQQVAELANNAITHGRVPGRDFRLTLTLTLTPADTPRIKVMDARGDAMPREPGYGLLLVETLADTWGTRLGPPPTKSVWAELAASRSS
jgi:hypothetical protein